jgi:hypothetical protein
LVTGEKPAGEAGLAPPSAGGWEDGLAAFRSRIVHILTKVFVIFAAFLSVLMSALAVSYSVNADRIRQEMDDAKSAEAAARAQLAAKSDSGSRQLIQSQQEVSRLRQELANFEARVREADGQISQLTVELEKSKASRDALEGRIAQLGVSVETQASIINDYRTETTRLRDEELRWRNEKLGLEARVSDLESQNLVLDQRARAMTEQLAEAKGQINQALTGGATSASSSAPREILGPMVRGTVQDVRTEASTGDTLVRISLGTNDRVQKNSKLFLNRGGTTYLGDLVVVSADLNTAVGRIVNATPGQQVRVGDEAWSKLSF